MIFKTNLEDGVEIKYHFLNKLFTEKNIDNLKRLQVKLNNVRRYKLNRIILNKKFVNCYLSFENNEQFLTIKNAKITNLNIYNTRDINSKIYFENSEIINSKINIELSANKCTFINTEIGSETSNSYLYFNNVFLDTKKTNIEII